MPLEQDTHIQILGVSKKGKLDKKSRLTVKGKIRLEGVFFCVGQPASEIRIPLVDVQKLFKKRMRGGR